MNFGEFIPNVELFQSGPQIDSTGNSHDWTNDDLDQIVKNYDPKVNEAPIVVGHPKENGPAWGWTKGIYRNGDKLYGNLDIHPSFVQAIKEGLYKKRSVSLVKNNDGWNLHHVGFLGAVAPAVKGLADIPFADGEEYMSVEFIAKREGVNPKEGEDAYGNVPFADEKNKKYPINDEEHIRAAWNYINHPKNAGEYSPEDLSTIKGKIIAAWKAKIDPSGPPSAANHKESKKMNVKEWFQKTFGEMPDEVADTELPVTFTEADVAAKVEEAAKAAKEAAIAEFAETAKKAEAEAKFAARKTTVKATYDSLLAEGKVIPAMEKAGLLSFMETLSDVEEVQFTEAVEGEEVVKQTPYAFFCEFLKNLPKAIELGEVADFASDKGQGKNTDAEKAINEYCKEHKCSYKEAALAVSKKQPELFK
jgi:hypothetical protein